MYRLRTKQEIVAEYANKPVRRFLQLDMFDASDGGDDVVRPDEDGDCLFLGVADDLRTSGDWLPVRVQIAWGANRDDVLRMLKKIRAHLKKNWDAATGIARNDLAGGEWVPFDSEKYEDLADAVAGFMQAADTLGQNAPDWPTAERILAVAKRRVQHASDCEIPF